MTPEATASLYAQETGEIWLPMLQLTNAAWTGSEHLVSNIEPITHQGQVYEPFAFDVSAPSENENGDSSMAFVAENVSQTIMQRLRSASGPVDAVVFFVMASDPDTIQAGPFSAQIRAVTYDGQKVSGTMRAYPVMDEPWQNTLVTAADFPGLF